MTVASAARYLVGDPEAGHMSATNGGSEHNVATYTILVGGQAIDPSLAKQVREIKIQSYLRLPDTCTFAVGYEKGPPGGDQPIDENPFDIGQTLEVKLGAADDLTTRSLFNGQIVSLEMNFGAGGVELLCRGYDRSHVLMRSRRAQTFQNMTSSDIVTKIVQAAGFSPDCDSKRRSPRVRAAGQRDRLGLHLASRRTRRLRVRRRGHDRPLPKARRRRSDPARVADDAALVRATRHRLAAGPGGDTCHTGSEDQAGDLGDGDTADQVARDRR